MASRTLPGLGLTGYWDLGEDGWKDANDVNLRLLSAVTQGRALNLVSTTPGTPSNGDVYLFSASHPTQANKVAIYDNGAWVYITPASGWIVYDVTAGYHRKFDGSAWVQLTTGGGAATFSGALLKRSTTQSITGSTNTVVNWDAEEYDEGSWHSTSSNTSRITIPAGVSRVRLAARITRDDVINQLVVNILKNGADAIGMPWHDADTSGADSVSVASAVVSVTEGDYFEVQVYSDTGFAVQTTSWFSVEKVT